MLVKFPIAAVFLSPREALFDMFHRGMSERIKDKLLTIELPQTLDGLMNLAIEIEHGQNTIRTFFTLRSSVPPQTQFPARRQVQSTQTQFPALHQTQLPVLSQAQFPAPPRVQFPVSQPCSHALCQAEFLAPGLVHSPTTPQICPQCLYPRLCPRCYPRLSPGPYLQALP